LQSPLFQLWKLWELCGSSLPSILLNLPKLVEKNATVPTTTEVVQRNLAATYCVSNIWN